MTDRNTKSIELNCSKLFQTDFRIFSEIFHFRFNYSAASAICLSNFEFHHRYRWSFCERDSQLTHSIPTIRSWELYKIEFLDSRIKSSNHSLKISEVIDIFIRLNRQINKSSLFTKIHEEYTLLSSTFHLHFLMILQSRVRAKYSLFQESDNEYDRRGIIEKEAEER